MAVARGKGHAVHHLTILKNTLCRYHGNLGSKIAHKFFAPSGRILKGSKCDCERAHSLVNVTFAVEGYFELMDGQWEAEAWTQIAPGERT